MYSVLYLEDFVADATALFSTLHSSITWSTQMKSRKTASFGTAYNYSQMSYPYQKMPDYLDRLCLMIKDTIGFKPNNCLINYYKDGTSKMGYHADQIDILEENTGISIISLGTTRVLRFREIKNKTNKVDYPLTNGSLIYMSQELQNFWQHAIPPSPTQHSRMSLTFRKITQCN